MRSSFQPLPIRASNDKRETGMSQDKPLFTDADLIYGYSRAQALRDGVLIELPLAVTMGFRVPVAITVTAHAKCIAWPEPDPRLAAILAMREEAVLSAAVFEARAQRRRHLAGKEDQVDRIDFKVGTVLMKKGLADIRDVSLYMVIGPGDAGEPVATIMVIGED